MTFFQQTLIFQKLHYDFKIIPFFDLEWRGRKRLYSVMRRVQI